MRRDKIKPGMAVETQTVSGGACFCIVIKPLEDGLWLLESPEHGYAIVRHYTEIQKGTQ